MDVFRCVGTLIDGGILVEESSCGEEEEQNWDPITLAFHRNSRGAVRREEASPPPQLRTLTPLRTVSLPTAQEEPLPIPELLQSRRSIREWPGRSLGLQVFSMFLNMCLGERGPPPEGPSCVSRCYPSGGALYSLECYPVLSTSAVKGLSAGVYRYQARSRTLETTSTDSCASVQLLEAAGVSAGSSPPPILLIVTSHYRLPSATYGALAYSLVLKEVGALFQTFYLVAEYLGLAACALGGGTPDDLFAKLIGTSRLSDPIVGEFMLGPR
jgi:SagB-type dehydrogenase family enzyme